MPVENNAESDLAAAAAAARAAELAAEAERKAEEAGQAALALAKALADAEAAKKAADAALRQAEAKGNVTELKKEVVRVLSEKLSDLLPVERARCPVLNKEEEQRLVGALSVMKHMGLEAEVARALNERAPNKPPLKLSERLDAAFPAQSPTRVVLERKLQAEFKGNLNNVDGKRGIASEVQSGFSVLLSGTKAAALDSRLPSIEEQKAKVLKSAQDQTRAVLAKQPPDVHRIKVAPKESAQALMSLLEKSVGYGDETNFEQAKPDIAKTLQEFSGILSGQTHPTRLKVGPSGEDINNHLNTLLQPALTVLASQQPKDTAMRVLALANDAIPPQDSKAGLPYQPRTAFELLQKNQKQQYVFNPNALEQPAGLKSAIERSGKAKQWQAAFNAGADKTQGQFSLSELAKRGNSQLIIQGLVNMAPEDQAAVLKAFGEGAPPDAQRPMGGLFLDARLLRSDGIQMPSILASADAGGVVGAQSKDAPVAMATNVGAVANLQKQYNFYKENFDGAIAEKVAMYSQLIGDKPQVLNPTQLSNHIGTASEFPPDNLPVRPEDITVTDPVSMLRRAKAVKEWEAVKTGDWPLYKSDGEAGKVIAKIQRKIEDDISGVPARVTPMPVFFNSKETGLMQLPLFRVVNKSNQDVFVDNTGREYKSFPDYLAYNKLPEGEMRVPKDGRLGNGYVAYDNKGQWSDKVVRGLDNVAFVGGVFVAGAAVIGTGGLAIPVVGSVTALYGAVRAGTEVANITNHETLDLTNSEHRGAVLNLGANVVGFAALGFQAGRILNPGVKFAQVANAAGVASDVLDISSIANSFGIDWGKLPADQQAMLLSQNLFFGGLTLHSARKSFKNPASGLSKSSIAGAEPRVAPQEGLATSGWRSTGDENQYRGNGNDLSYGGVTVNVKGVPVEQGRHARSKAVDVPVHAIPIAPKSTAAQLGRPPVPFTRGISAAQIRDAPRAPALNHVPLEFPKIWAGFVPDPSRVYRLGEEAVDSAYQYIKNNPGTVAYTRQGSNQFEIRSNGNLDVGVRRLQSGVLAFENASLSMKDFSKIVSRSLGKSVRFGHEIPVGWVPDTMPVELPKAQSEIPNGMLTAIGSTVFEKPTLRGRIEFRFNQDAVSDQMHPPQAVSIKDMLPKHEPYHGLARNKFGTQLFSSGDETIALGLSFLFDNTVAIKLDSVNPDERMWLNVRAPSGGWRVDKVFEVEAALDPYLLQAASIFELIGGEADKISALISGPSADQLKKYRRTKAEVKARELASDLQLFESGTTTAKLAEIISWFNAIGLDSPSGFQLHSTLEVAKKTASWNRSLLGGATDIGNAYFVKRESGLTEFENIFSTITSATSALQEFNLGLRGASYYGWTDLERRLPKTEGLASSSGRSESNKTIDASIARALERTKHEALMLKLETERDKTLVLNRDGQAVPTSIFNDIMREASKQPKLHHQETSLEPSDLPTGPIWDELKSVLKKSLVPVDSKSASPAERNWLNRESLSGGWRVVPTFELECALNPYLRQGRNLLHMIVRESNSANVATTSAELPRYREFMDYYFDSIRSTSIEAETRRLAQDLIDFEAGKMSHQLKEIVYWLEKGGLEGGNVNLQTHLDASKAIANVNQSAFGGVKKIGDSWFLSRETQPKVTQAADTASTPMAIHQWPDNLHHFEPGTHTLYSVQDRSVDGLYAYLQSKPGLKAHVRLEDDLMAVWSSADGVLHHELRVRGREPKEMVISRDDLRELIEALESKLIRFGAQIPD
jgi:hypothetical protein